MKCPLPLRFPTFSYASPRRWSSARPTRRNRHLSTPTASLASEAASALVAAAPSAIASRRSEQTAHRDI
eukprot:9494500-Pyramimonas_sp.AAC.1